MLPPVPSNAISFLSMFVPLITSTLDLNQNSKSLLRRKGGGGGGHGSSGHSSSAKGASSKSGASSNAATSPAITSGGKTFKTSPTSSGGVPKSIIPPNQPFAGREVGGGTRAQVYGSSTYGSGYPGTNGRGVQGHGFPFIFYPVVFAAPIGAGGGFYLYREEEYGKADNTSRPGGPLRQVSFSSNSSTFHIVSDNTTITSLRNAINTTCSNSTFAISSILPYNSSQTPYPKPEEAIQYYRASSVVLTLDGYNNTAALNANETTPPVPLPANVDIQLLSCINHTIGTTVPLVNAASDVYSTPVLQPLFLLALLSMILS